MYDKSAELLKRDGITAYRVSKDTGIAWSVIGSWKISRSIPKADKLKILADYFGVTIDYFLD